MNRHTHPPALVFRSPLVCWLMELLLTMTGTAALTLALALVAPAVWLVVFALGFGFALLRARHYYAGAVIVQGGCVILRRGFFIVREARCPLSHTRILVSQNRLLQMLDWATVHADIDGCAVEGPLVTRSYTLRWVLRDRTLLLAATGGTPPLYYPGARGVALLPDDEDLLSR